MSTPEERKAWITESPIPDDSEEMTDAEKLRTLAVWFDLHDSDPKGAHALIEEGFVTNDEVQRDLWRMADELEARV